MTIKETAGKVLLYFYKLQRATPLTMSHRQVGFLVKKEGGLTLTSDKVWLTKDLLGINPSASDILNALIFLRSKELIESTERAAATARIYMGVQLTDKGIDIIEGIEHGHDGKRTFDFTFNIKVDESMDVEGLIKDSLRTLSD